MRGRHQLQALRPLIQLAAAHLSELPPGQRADVYEGIAITLDGLDPKLAEQAKQACQAIRDAESHQLTFASLLRQTAS